MTGHPNLTTPPADPTAPSADRTARWRDPALDRHLRTYLFTDGSITEIEHDAEHGDD